MFDNVFVNPAAYQAFVKTGTWPDKTMLVLEGRGARGKRLDQSERELSGGPHGSRGAREGRSALSRVNGPSLASTRGKTAKMIPTTADCYSCHADHAAVDTTFVQFYPTLLPIATSKGTLSAAYLKEIAAPAQK